MTTPRIRLRAGRRFAAHALVAALAVLSGCAQAGGKGTSAARAAASSTRDVHTLTRPDEAKVTHAVLDWTVDFDAKRIRGSVTWDFERAAGHEDAPLRLDTNGLAIQAVETTEGVPLEFEMGGADDVLGTPLIIEAPPGLTRVKIDYATPPDAAGLQWLRPAETAGKEHPFLFSQAQAILARTFVPCQDSPGVRITYDANVTVPDGLTAVMAAERLPPQGKILRFRMPQPIPSYLIAIAVGEIEFREIGRRTGVYAEPPTLEAAAWEFADTEKMVEAAEKLFGPYRWDRYDILVLPPSFPLGGMENPRLTFATPTVLAGDRSLVSLVSHELAHSWSGNLVTNATWSDFWLNEGVTDYLERRIQESLYGKERAEMEAVLGEQDLLAEMPGLSEGFTALHNVSLEGRDPDDGSSIVPYEKGYLFLRMLDENLGREKLDPFLRRWFDANAFRSRTTGDFEIALRDDLFEGGSGRMEALKIGEWLYGPGLPGNAPKPRSGAFARVEAAMKGFAGGETPAAGLPGKEWSTQEWIHMIRNLPAGMPVARMAELDRAWNLTGTGNSEILVEWLLRAIEMDYEPAYPALASFLERQGRTKFLKPLYAELAKTPEGKKRALEIYAKARPTYHSLSASTIDEILGYGRPGA